MSQKIFYQSSLPRSGSTLLQNILGQNPDFYVTPTSGVFDLVFGARAHYTTGNEFKAQDKKEMKKAFLGFCRMGMQGYFQSLTDKPYIVDKSRGWAHRFDLLQMIWGEDPKIICVVRDLRQILASFEKKVRENPDQYSPLESDSKNTVTTTHARALTKLQDRVLGVPLDRLVEVYQRGWNHKMLILRYEDMTAQPAVTLQKVYQYLGVPEFAHDFDHVVQITQEDDTVHGIPGLHDIRPKVEPLQNDYMEILGRDVVRHVQTQFAWYFKLFNYHLVSA